MPRTTTKPKAPGKAASAAPADNNLAWLAGIFETRIVLGTSAYLERYSFVDKREEIIETLIQISGLGEIVSFRNKANKEVYGWRLTQKQERDILKRLMPFFKTARYRERVEGWLAATS